MDNDLIQSCVTAKGNRSYLIDSDFHIFRSENFSETIFIDFYARDKSTAVELVK